MTTDTFEAIVNWAFIIFTGASLLVPVMQFVAKQTATKADDEWVEKIATFVHDALAFLPVARRGRTLGQKELIDSVPARALEPAPTKVASVDVKVITENKS